MKTAADLKVKKKDTFSQYVDETSGSPGYRKQDETETLIRQWQSKTIKNKGELKKLID